MSWPTDSLLSARHSKVSTLAYSDVQGGGLTQVKVSWEICFGHRADVKLTLIDAAIKHTYL